MKNAQRAWPKTTCLRKWKHSSPLTWYRTLPLGVVSLVTFFWSTRSKACSKGWWKMKCNLSAKEKTAIKASSKGKMDRYAQPMERTTISSKDTTQFATQEIASSTSFAAHVFLWSLMTTLKLRQFYPFLQANKVLSSIINSQNTFSSSITDEVVVLEFLAYWANADAKHSSLVYYSSMHIM